MLGRTPGAAPTVVQTLVRVHVARPTGDRRPAEVPAAVTMPIVRTGPVARWVVTEPRAAVPVQIVDRAVMSTTVDRDVTMMTVDRDVTATTDAPARPEAAIVAPAPLVVAGGLPAIGRADLAQIVAAQIVAVPVEIVARADDPLRKHASRVPPLRSAPLRSVRAPAVVAPTSTNHARVRRSLRRPGSTKGRCVMQRSLQPNAP